ncbi:MAG: family 10 glycosylhydrolase [Cyanobacteria bacterium P01_E01_bin.42]
MQRQHWNWFKNCLLFGLIASLAIAFLNLPISPRVLPEDVGETRGVWLTNVNSGVLFLPWGIQRAVHSLAELRFNTLYPVVWNRGNTFFPSAIATEATGRDREPFFQLMHPNSDVLQEIVDEGHRQGLKVIPWFEYGLMTPQGSALAKQHPDWLTQSLDRQRQEYRDAFQATEETERAFKFPNPFTIHQVWLNPLHPEVRAFIKGIIVEVVQNYDIDGIQLDDHFGMPVEMGYDDLTIEIYQEEHGGKLPPQDSHDARWMGWRANKITELMTEIYQEVKAVKPDCLISLSPNSQSYAYTHYLQNWQVWVARGIIDELILQVYRSDRDRFINELSLPPVRFAKQRIPVSIGILSGVLTKPVPMQMIQEQVRIVRDRGFSGVSFFYWESLWGYLAPESPYRRRQGFKDLFLQRNPEG